MRREVIWPVRYRVRPDEVCTFLRVLKLCWKHGMPLQEALGHLSRCTRNDNMAGVLRDAYEYAAEGGRFSVLMAARPWVFRPEQVELIAAAEEAGGLDRALGELISRIDVDIELRRYLFPLTICWWCMLIIPCLCLGFRFLRFQMPVAPRIYLHGFHWTDIPDSVGFTLAVCVVVGLAVAAFRVVATFRPRLRSRWDALRSYVPIAGPIHHQFAVARFCRTFACTFGSGLVLGVAIRAAGRSCGSDLLERAADRVSVDAGFGSALSRAFARTGRFPRDVLAYLETGEHTGRIDELMNHAADQIEKDAMHRIHVFTCFAAYVVVMLVFLIMEASILFENYRLPGRDSWLGQAGGAQTAPPPRTAPPAPIREGAGWRPTEHPTAP